MKRPFRTPHHTASAVSLCGGGTRTAHPGEISLAHGGVLFLDELPEYKRSALEALRQPLEDGVITISRSGGSVTYPASFMLCAGMNPCPCGNYGSRDRRCTCTPNEIRRYRARVSRRLRRPRVRKTRGDQRRGKGAHRRRKTHTEGKIQGRQGYDERGNGGKRTQGILPFVQRGGGGFERGVFAAQIVRARKIENLEGGPHDRGSRGAGTNLPRTSL